jgi:COP9 signalosome complex subunit 6
MSVATEAAATSDYQIALHPLVILNVSDHYTRQKALSRGGPVKRVAGCILGLADNGKVEIANSFEVPILKSNALDIKFLATKTAQLRKVFPQYEVLGWYSTGSSQPEPDDINIQRSLIDGFTKGIAKANEEPEPICERPIYLLLDTHMEFKSDGKELPITAYESILHSGPSGETSLVFECVERYRLKPESGEAERISVDHISRAGAAAGAGGASALTTQLGGIKHAITMLHERINMLQKYLAAVQDGTLKPNRSVLREVLSLCSRLPIVDPVDFFTDYNDTLLVTYLCSITQV